MTAFKQLTVWDDGPGGLRTDIGPFEDDDLADIVGYLRAGRVLIRVSELLPDPLSADRPRVPVSLRTDGVWMWDDAVGYFLANHRLAPDPSFLDYVRERNYVPRVPSAAEVATALALTQG